MIYNIQDKVKRENTQYEGLYKYTAPEGYRFWVENTCYGNVIWGNEKLDNPYYLKEIDK